MGESVKRRYLLLAVETLFSWIHLSDLHVGCGDVEQTMKLDALRSDIVQATEQARLRPDAILITGNTACCGDPEGRLLDLGEAAQLGPEAIFMVPGDHETTRSAEHDRSVQRLVMALREGKEPFDDALEYDREMLARRQAEYLRHAARFGPPDLDKDRLFWAHRWTGRGTGVRLVGWNTALLVDADDDRGKLRLGNAQVALLRPPGVDDVVVVLSHHPLRGGWLVDGKDAEAWLRHHAAVHLSGAAAGHDSEQVRDGTGGGLVRISTGAGPSYNIAAVVRTERGALVLHIWPRRWSDRKKAFCADPDQALEGRAYAEHELRPARTTDHLSSRPKVWTSTLPSPRASTFGRSDELRALHEGWADHRTHVVAVVGWGGSGKSQLVGSWLADLAPGYGGAERVFGWSFYAQGTSPRAAVSSDEFFRRAFSFFGGQPQEKDAVGWAHELACLIRVQPTLLVLDGLEPLQDPARGGVRDPALRCLLKELVASMNGVCLVTTRPPFVELDGFKGGTFRRIDLPPLGAEAGVELLRERNVYGDDDDLRAAVAEYRGHALSLAVLGNYLAEAWHGDIRRRSHVGLTEGDIDDEHRIRRVLASYDAHLGPLPRQILRAVALFERPALMDYLHALRKGNVLPGSSGASTPINEAGWNKAASALRRADLISLDDRARTLDAHPLIRAHFAWAFEAEDGGAFRAAHGLIFDHLRALAPKRPSTLDEMQHLYQAVSHGCHAQRWDDAFDVLHDRIRQGTEHVSLHKLGAVSADLAAFACFFSAAWEPASELSPWQRHWLQNSAGVLHRAEGNLEDARRLLAAALDTARAEGWQDRAAETARNLASTESAMGRLKDALATVERAIRFADASGELRARVVSRDFRAHLLNRRGLLRESRAAFEEVERMRDAEDRDGKLLHYPEASFAALLVELGEPEEACRRARKALDMTGDSSSDRGSLLNIGLSERSLARALAALGRAEEAARLFDDSIEHLRRASRRDHLAPGLVDRAKFLLRRDPEQAACDIEEAIRLASPRGFRLVEADTYLTRARLEIAGGRAENAQGSLERARTMVEETGFELRVPMLLIAEALLHASRGDRHAAERTLSAARHRADAMGMLGLNDELAHASSMLGR